MKFANKKRISVFDVINIVIMICVVIITLYPFLYLTALSMSSEKYVYAGEITFYPKGFTLGTYRVLLKDSDFWISYRNTIIYTVVGTVISLALTVLLAYPLSKKNLKGRGVLLGFILFTMFFSGGLIPTYLLVSRMLQMRNTIWAVIIPGAISTYNVLVTKTFFEGIPDELEEAAAIDGMNTYGILFRIVLPLSKPILATMSLFYAVGIWNNWFGPFIYLDMKELFPVSLYLRNIIAGAQKAREIVGGDVEGFGDIEATIKSASMVVSALPIIMIYPFVQKYFVKGIMIGSLKG
ncbi:carbohydrate ABC transporter membrane protein 2, CUT1 family [Caldicoprobacter faecalis]|uniref:Carbohydrate ABC transporter membrane protein 2, CUT1 family n=2 Tax=Caldicoprobacter faecalis TaxID=937334 RepID=A0A1I5XEJ5_9FIRM|nr:carbohydrate ABC transporter permease [Caldicoprobacter faecalis]SFQ30402.1 carbohydrate ABC transporter membrane protein 2, CUT1 family [Caldicoprobacter faecalis]